jgi:hypothetical protein
MDEDKTEVETAVTVAELVRRIGSKGKGAASTGESCLEGGIGTLPSYTQSPLWTSGLRFWILPDQIHTVEQRQVIALRLALATQITEGR